MHLNQRAGFSPQRGCCGPLGSRRKQGRDRTQGMDSRGLASRPHSSAMQAWECPGTTTCHVGRRARACRFRSRLPCSQSRSAGVSGPARGAEAAAVFHSQRTVLHGEALQLGHLVGRKATRHDLFGWRRPHKLLAMIQPHRKMKQPTRFLLFSPLLAKNS